MRACISPSAEPDSHWMHDAVDLEAWVDARDSTGRGLGSTVDSRLWALRYYRKRQIARRLWNMAASRLGLRPKCPRVQSLYPLPRERAGDGFTLLFQFRAETWRRDMQPTNTWQSLAAGDVCLLNRRLHLGSPVDWRISAYPDVAYLWRFQLHYHEFLFQVAMSSLGDLSPGHASSASPSFSPVVSAILDWIENNPIGSRACHLDAWHPYCISRRIPVWLMIEARGREAGDGRQQEVVEPFDRISQSLYLQAAFLVENLEWDLRGNHLLENVKAVCLAACAYRTAEADRWLERMLPILRVELQQQVLPHGEHFERSPMYHCQILGNLLEMAVVSESVFPPLYRLCLEYVRPMWGFLQGILHPDGEIPLFADSCFGEAPSVAYIRRLAEHVGIGDVDECRMDSHSLTEGSPSPGSLPQAGKGPRNVQPYWTFRQGGDFLVFDRGNVGADELPAHAHCDLLTLEASFGGQRVIVDSGLYNYADDSMRRYVRSSEAHNVVTVDGQNQCDIWSSFRMGYRGWATAGRQGESGGFVWATARHNAYRRHNVPRMQRLVAGHADRIWTCLDRAVPVGRDQPLRVSDRCPTDTDSPVLTGYLHFAPSVRLTQIAADQFRVQTDCEDLFLRLLNVVDAQVAAGWYCPAFGRRLRAPVLVYKAHSQPFGWVMADKRFDCRFVEDAHPSLLSRAGEEAGGDALKISTAGALPRSYRLQLDWDYD